MRLHTLDYLRGLAAFGIMFYHYSGWLNNTHHDPNSFIGKVGYYGVSIFYVLSGLTLYHVYFKKMRYARDLKSFARKRIFRIFPLMWVAMISSLIAFRPRVSIDTLLLNFSGLFGFVRPWDYIGTGMWSIGNELVFYAFFPAFVLFYRKDKNSIWVFGMALFVVYCYFAFVEPYSWEAYVNPLNQVFLFYCGFVIGLMSPTVKRSWIFILVGLGLFICYPAHEVSDLVTGWGRMVFTFCCLLVVYGFYRLNFSFPKVIHYPLSKLGEASYSVYLLHPLVLFGFNYVRIKIFHAPLNPLVALVVCVLATVVLSYLVYLYFEKRFIDYARGRAA